MIEGTRMGTWIVVGLVAVGCSPSVEEPMVSGITPDAAREDARVRDADPDPDVLVPDAAVPDAASSDADPEMDGGVVEFDCATIPPAPLSTQMMAGARGYHGLAISDEGYIIGSDGSSLVQATYAGAVSLFVPGIGSGQQMDWLDDGDLVYATSDGALTRVMKTGAYAPILSGVFAYGVVVGPDAMIYAAQGTVDRVHPTTGASEQLIAGLPSGSIHSIGFNPAGKRLYIGTIGGGSVYYLDFDTSMNPIGGPQVLATGVGGWHDAVAVDACGYLYVPDYNTRSVYRISPSGAVSLFFQPANPQHYPHGLVWGNGKGGWREDALYAPQPYNGNTVIEMVVGVPPRDFEGTVLNPPPQLP